MKKKLKKNSLRVNFIKLLSVVNNMTILKRYRRSNTPFQEWSRLLIQIDYMDKIDFLESHLSDALIFFLTNQQVLDTESEIYNKIKEKSNNLIDAIITKFNEDYEFQTKIWTIIHNKGKIPESSQDDLRINVFLLYNEIIENLPEILSLQENRAIIKQFLEQAELELSAYNQHLPQKRKGDQDDGGPSKLKRPRYDYQTITNQLKKSIETIFNRQSPSVQEEIKKLYGFDPTKSEPLQSRTNPFQKNIEDCFVIYKNPHQFFSMFYWKLSTNLNKKLILQKFADELAQLWIELLESNEIAINSMAISGTYNSLSKLKILTSETFKSLIICLIAQAENKNFVAQGIANIFNAFSKFDILNPKVWSSENEDKFKFLIMKLTTQAIQLTKQAKYKHFNPQNIANILNGFSKFDILNPKVWSSENQDKLKFLIIQLTTQAENQNFNAQGIGNIFNAVSKFDIFNPEVWSSENEDNFKFLIMKLTTQAIQLTEQTKYKHFNPQNIANIFSAFSKFDILNPKVWSSENQDKLKFLIMQLTAQALKIHDFNSQDIANIFNAVSKFDILNSEVWNSSEKQQLKSLIIQLTAQALKIENFNAQGIGNIFSAFSKFDILNSEVWSSENKDSFKFLIMKLTAQAKDQNFNAQSIGNIFNGFSKFDILNSEIWNSSKKQQLKSLIIQLTKQALKIEDFNPQNIANIFNGISKFDILNSEIWNSSEKQQLKSLIIQLTKQAKDQNFNAQEIASTYNAFSKFDILNSEVWNSSEKQQLKSLIIQLTAQAKDQNFDAQKIVSIYIAFLKFDILNSEVWNSSEKQQLKSLIIQLTEQAKDQNFDAQKIVSIYNTLSKWINTDIWSENENGFKTLIIQLTEQALKIQDFNPQNIANIFNVLLKYPKSIIKEYETVFQELTKIIGWQVINAKEVPSRDAAYIIKDLSKLKALNLITDDYPLKKLLVSLIKSFSEKNYKNKFTNTNLSSYFANENYWTAVGINNLAQCIVKLNLNVDDKQELKRTFDDSLQKITNRLMKFGSNLYRIISILEGVSQLISLDLASNDNDNITQFLHKLFKNLNESDRKKLTAETLAFLELYQEEVVTIHKLTTEDLTLTTENIIEEAKTEVKKYHIPEDLEAFKKEVLFKEGIIYQPSNDNVEEGNFKIFIAPVLALGKDQWGIYTNEAIAVGQFLGIYAGEEIDNKEANENRKTSDYIFELSKDKLVDASKKRNWAAYINYGINGIANINAFISYTKTKQIELKTSDTIDKGQQLLLDYGNNYFSNVDYLPIYLDSSHNWKTPQEHYDDHKTLYRNDIIQLPNDMVEIFGLTQSYIIASDAFATVYDQRKELSVSLAAFSDKTIDLPSYTLEFVSSSKKWKFSEYSKQQHITALMLAAYQGNAEAVQLQLNRGANPIRRTLHQGHNSLFLAVLSNAEIKVKAVILEKLINHTFNELKRKSDNFYATGYEKPINYDKLLLKDFSQFLQSTDASDANIFDHMIEKEEYSLWKKCFNYQIKGDDVNNKENKKRIAEKFITDKGILSIIAHKNYDQDYQEIVEILLTYPSQQFIEEHLKDLEESGEINTIETKKIDQILENLCLINQKNKKGKMVNIVTALLYNKTNKLKNDKLTSLEQLQELEKQFTKVLEHLNSKNKLDSEIRLIKTIIDAKCLQSRERVKRASPNNNCISWDDIDQFNEAKKDPRKLENIKIDSKKFLNYLQDLPDEKRTALLALIDKLGKKQVEGRLQTLVSRIVENEKIMNNLNKVGKFSGLLMHGMMGKAILGDFLNHNYPGVAFNLGFMAGGQMFAKIAEAASIKAINFMKTERLFLGRSLAITTPFLARGTSAFMIYDLVKQIEDYKSGNADALVGIIGDSIYLGTDAIIIATEAAETLGLIAEVSTVLGPIGTAIGAVVFIGTDIYLAVKKVDKIDQIIHLTGWEKFTEGWRAFIGVSFSAAIQELINQKQFNNQLMHQGLEFLKHNTMIDRYIFPIAKVNKVCHWEPYVKIIQYGSVNGKYTTKAVTKQRLKCNKSSITEISNNKVFLNQTSNNFLLSRTSPDQLQVGNGKLFCLLKGNDGIIQREAAYACENAIGVEILTNKGKKSTLIHLGNGDDEIVGFLKEKHIVVLGNGHKNVILGNGNDTVFLNGDNISGSIDAGSGIDTLDLGNFLLNSKINYFGQNILYHNGEVSYNLKTRNFENILGRKDQIDVIYGKCQIKYIDGRGGKSENQSDLIIVNNEENCSNKTQQIVVRTNTEIKNYSLNGTFKYIVNVFQGQARISLFGSAFHNFVFNYAISAIENIDKTKNRANFNFSNLNISIIEPTTGRQNISYFFNDNSKIVFGNHNIMILHNTNQSVSNIIDHFLPIVTRLGVYFSAQSGNETVIMAHKNNDILTSDTSKKTHLIGGNGENIYIINPPTNEIENSPLSNVVIYNFDGEDHGIDTIDFRSLFNKAVSKKLCQQIELKIKQNNGNLDLALECLKVNDGKKYSISIVELKDGITWYEKIYVIIEDIPMKIERLSNMDFNQWIVTALPLNFSKDYDTICISTYDVVSYQEINIEQTAGQYQLLKDHNNLIITYNNKYNVIIQNYFTNDMMETLKINFIDQAISLSQINKSNMTTLDEIENQYQKERNNILNQLIIVRNTTTKSNNTNAHVSHSREKRYIKIFIDNSPFSKMLFYGFGISKKILLEPKKNDVMEKYLKKDDTKHQSFSSKNLSSSDSEIYAKITEKTQVTSSANKPKSWINGAVISFTSSMTNIGKSISQLLSYSIEPLSATSEKPSVNYSSNSKRNPNSKFCQQFSNEICIQRNSEAINILFQAWLDKKYPLPEWKNIDQKEEAQAYAINITYEFNQVLKYTSQKCGISAQNLAFNCANLQSVILKQALNNENNISETLVSSAKAACPDFKQTNKFINYLSDHLEEISVSKKQKKFSKTFCTT